MSNKLPPKEHSFRIDVEGSDTRQKWTGNFTYKRPGISVQTEIDLMATRLNQDLANLNDDRKFLHLVIATLSFTLKESPTWLKEVNFGYHEDWTDTNVLLDIYSNIQKFEKERFDKLWGDQDSVKIETKKEDEPESEVRD